MGNSAPSLGGVAGSRTYAESDVNATPQLIDPDVTFADAEGNFSGGTVRVTGLLAEDRVGILTEGLLSAASGSVSYNGTIIGTYAGGVGNSFTVTLNASATSVAVDALIEHLTYANVSDTPTASRTLTINVFDGAGADIEGAPSLVPLAGAANPFNSFTTAQSYILPTGIDFDDDGDIDLVVGTDDGTLLAFRNNGDGSFTQLIGVGANPFNGVDVGGFSAPAAGDVDNDGDLDLVVGSDTHLLATYRNNGQGNFTQVGGGANPFNGLNFSTISQPSAGDFDNDGDCDFIVTEASATVHSFRNNGDGTFTELTGAANPFAAFTGQSVGSAFVDIDFDGDSDVVMGRSNGTLVYGRNNGDGTFTELTGASNPFNGIDTGSYSSPVFVDIDGDSDLDMISGSSTGVLTTWRNDAVHGQSITINVTAQAENIAPTVGANLGLTLDEGATGPIATAQLDFNDAEQPDTAITYTLTAAANGTLLRNGVALATSDTFTQADINDGLIAYLHDGGETISGSFGFSVSDGAGGNVAGQSFAFTITPVNDAAILSADTLSPSETDAAADISASGTLTISDVDSPTIFVAQDGTAGSYGSFAIDTAGAWTYTASSAHDAFVTGAVYTDTFTVASADGTTTSVTIDIAGTNDAAILSADVRNLSESDAAVDIGSSGTLTISDVDSPTTFVAQAGTPGTYGSFAIDIAGGWTYSASGAHDAFVAGAVYTDTFTVAAADGTTTSVTINLTGTNDAAILSADVRNLSETNAAADIGSSGTLTISDVDSATTFVAQVATSGTYGSFAIDAAGAWTYTASSAHDAFVAGAFYTDTFTVAAADGTTTSVTINLTGTNDAPAIDLNGADGGTSATLAYTENGAAAAIAPTATLFDVDSANFDTGTLSLSFGAGGSFGDRLTILHAGSGVGEIGVAGSAVSFAGTQIGTFTGGTEGAWPLLITLDPDATPAAVEALTRAVAFSNVSDAPSTAARSVDFVLTDGDGGASAVATATITLASVNDAPTVAIGTIAAADEQVALDLKGKVAVTDADSGAGRVTVTLTVDYGVLTVTAGASGATVLGSGTDTVTIEGTIAQVRALLDTDATSVFTYTADTDAPPASARLGAVVNDNGHEGTDPGLSGDGTSEEGTDSATITIDAVNDSPTGADNGESVIEDQVLTFTAAHFSTGFSDPDGDALAAVRVTTLPSTGTIELDGVAINGGDTITLAQLDGSQLIFVPAAGSAGTAPTFTFQVQDDGGSANGGVDLDATPDTFTASIAPIGAVAQDDAFTVAENAIVSGSVFGDNGHGADNDSGGPSLEATEVNGAAADVGTALTLASGARLTLNSNGAFSYDPNRAFDFLSAPGSGAADTQATDSFTYTLLNGNAATVTLTIRGVDGNDVLVGTNGDDTRFGGFGKDALIGRSGHDRLDGGSGNDRLYGDFGNDVLIGGSGRDQLYGGVGDDSLFGDADTDILDGGKGADTMEGGAGNDTYRVDHVGDVVMEGPGGGKDLVLSTISYALPAQVENLTLLGGGDLSGRGNAGDNKLIGNSGDNYLAGYSGNDLLSGSAGDDTLIGGSGLDILIGGDGADDFIFNARPAKSNTGRIYDFVSGEDRIVLDEDVFTEAGQGALGGAFQLGSTALEADDRIVYDEATGNIYYDADGTGGAAAIMFAAVSPGTVILHSDFFVG